MNISSRPRLLLVGAASELAPPVAALFAPTHQIIGIDSRALGDPSMPLDQFIQIGYTKRRIADIFRIFKFDLLIHIGRIGSTSRHSREVRFEQNVYGSKNLLNLGLQHGIKQFIVVGTHLVYGALRDNPLYLREEEPLRASETSPELMDSIELDLETRAFIWRHRNVKTVLLRPAYIVGPHAHHALATLMRGRYCPKLIGFDPLLQFVHEDDVARAIMAAAASSLYGVYNVAGEGVVPYSAAINLAGGTPVPIPESLANLGLGIFPLLKNRLPKHVIDYIKYPIVISDRTFRESTGWAPSKTIVDCMKSLRENLPTVS